MTMSTKYQAEFAKKLCTKKQASKQVWTTPGGTMTTSTKCQAQFTIPELFDNQVIEWDLYVAPKMGAYEMIIGQDLLTDLESISDFPRIQ
jgi:streptogramin lyase